MKSCKLNFRYLGSRDYLDISSITDSFWNSFGVEKREFIKNLEFKLLKEIKFNCELKYEELHRLDSGLKDKAVAELYWEIESQMYQGYFLATAERITEREPEQVFKFEEYCDLTGDRVRLNKLFRQDTCYNLMKMGKYLVTEKYGPDVRVVKYVMKYFVPSADMIGSEMSLSPLPGGQFLRLSCFKKDLEFGQIIIRRNQS